MRKFEYTIQKPISVKKLVSICNGIKDMTLQQSIEYGKKNGICRHDVESIRHMLGFAKPELFKHKTKKEREAIVEEYREGGISMQKLAAKHGMCYNSVRCLLVNRDVTITTSRNWKPRQEKFLIDGLKRKKSLQQIADEIGKSKRCIIQKIKRMKRDGIIKE